MSLAAAWRAALMVAAFAALGATGAAPQGLGDAQLLIAGSRLTIDPAQQTVPFDTATIVNTRLEGFDPERGTLPPDLRVVGDFVGPEIGEALVLETVPNQPFRIPRLTLKGDYRLENVRLMQGEEVLAFAEPRDAGILVTQILVTRVTSRPLTTDEIRAHGIIIDDDSFQTFELTFGFAVEPDREVELSVPFVVPSEGGGSGGDLFAIPTLRPPRLDLPDPPSVRPFALRIPGLRPEEGGCVGACFSGVDRPLPAAIVFPTDNVVLNQFFEVMLLAQNGAPEGDPLVIRDLTADLDLPLGLRPVETEPPMPFGVPVPVRVPGLDGELGTGDDSALIRAQETGEAQFLIEGQREGNHIVSIDLAGILEGLPGGLETVTGEARGAVLVRNPTFGITLSHPSSVKPNQEYELRLTVTNTSSAPANLLTIRLPAGGVAGAEIVGSNQRTIDTLLPRETVLASFRARSRVEGRVIATAVRSGDQASGSIELRMEVGDARAPDTPNAIAVPPEAETLPEELKRDLFRFLGLAFTSATTPTGALEVDIPRVGRGVVEARVFQLAQAGRHHNLGEPLFDTAALLAAEWAGAADRQWDWDELRRVSPEGALAGAGLGRIFAAEAAASSPREALDRFAQATVDLPPMAAMLGAVAGAQLEIRSLTSGGRLFGSGVRNDRLRELPFGDLFDLGGGQMALLAVPEEGGYEVRLRPAGAGSPELHLLLPGEPGELRVVRWAPLPAMASGGLAVVEVRPGNEALILRLDREGDGVVDDEIPATPETLQPRPFTALSALQNSDADKTSHVVDVLFSRQVELSALLPADPGRFTVAGKVTNGGVAANEAGRFAAGERSRIVRVVFDNPLSPLVEPELTIRDVASAAGDLLGEQRLPITMQIDTPGIVLTGRVIGPDGEPVPFAPVVLSEDDFSPFAGRCVRHRTASVLTDVNGEYTFDYVRRTECGGHFQLLAVHPEGSHERQVQDRVRTPGETVRLDIVMLGRGTVRGRVLFDDGTVPAGFVNAFNDTFAIGKTARIDDSGFYEIHNVPVGTITLLARALDGVVTTAFTTATIELPTAGAVAVKDLTILRRPELEVGELRGRVLDVDGETPVFNAYVLVRASTKRPLGAQFTDAEGRFRFDMIPAGPVFLEVISSETGRAGGMASTEVPPDGVAEVDVLLVDERGTVEGQVFLRTFAGLEPLPMATVWAEGTPVNTTSDEDGFYRLSGVFSGTRQIQAVDAERTAGTAETVSITFDGQVVRRDLIIDSPVLAAGVAGEVLEADGTPVEGAVVHLARGPGAVLWTFEAFTDSDGRFLIDNATPGSWIVHGTKGADGGTAAVEVLGTGQTPFVSIRFQRGTIRGRVRVRQESGELVGIKSAIDYSVPTVRYGLINNWDEQTLETADDGTFEIPDVLIGDYTVAAFNPFFGERPQQGRLGFQGDVQEHDFVFEETTGRIRGTVRRFDGELAQGATVSLRHPSFASFDVTSDEEGRFLFDLVPPVSGRIPVDAFLDEGMVFRQARIYATLNRPGQQLDVEVVLPQQGRVSGFVEDELTGERLGNVSVRLQESRFPLRALSQLSDGDGAFSFGNVFEGPVTLSATTIDGRDGGKVTADVLEEGQELQLRIRIQRDVGSLSGRVVSPVDGSPAPSVQLELSGREHDFAVASTAGEFTFTELPAGSYTVEAFDPVSGRSGRLSRIEVGESEEVIGLELVLEARGSVEGTLADPDNGVGVPGETVQLIARSSFARLETYSSTDAAGVFLFDGIPEGELRLFARETGGRRQASAMGEIVAEDQRITVDLFWQPTGTILGTVLAPDGSGLPFAGPTTTIIEEEVVFGTFFPVGGTTDNPYSFDKIIVDRSFRILASEQGGPHRGEVTGRLEGDQRQLELDVAMAPIGTVIVTVVDSGGLPLPGIDVDGVADGFYGRFLLGGTTDGDGRLVFANVGEGRVSVEARDPVTELAGSGTAQVRFEGQEVPLLVTLADSGSVRGTVLLADGSTPAVGAIVSLATGETELLALADGAGAFELVGVALGGFELRVFEDVGPGQQRLVGSLSGNGEVVDFGDIVLDDRDPQLLDVQPPPAATEVAVDALPTIRFSEPIDRERFDAAWVTLLRTGGTSVPANRLWSEGDAALTLAPVGELQSFSSYQLRISGQILDRAGRSLGADVVTSFTTADVRPPTVVALSPADGAVNVALDVEPRVTFSEPVEAASLEGAFELLRLSSGEAVPLQHRQEADGREVVLGFASPLVPEELYRLTVQGVTDLDGNPMAAPVAATFESLDVTPPVIERIDIFQGTIFLSGDPMTIRATVSDNRGVVEVRFEVADRVFVDDLPRFELETTAPLVDEPTDVEVVVEAVDAAGNSAVATAPIRVEPFFDPNRPEISILCPSERVLLAPGTGIDLLVEASDEEGVERVDFFVGADPEPVATVDAPPASFVQRLALPLGHVEGEVVRLRALVTDVGGSQAEAGVDAEVVEGVVFAEDATIDADNLTFEDRTLIVTGGVVTIEGFHRFADLVILDGGTVAQAEPEIGELQRLELELTGGLYLACGGHLRADGAGYCPGFTRGWERVPELPALNFRGGSYGGRGGLFSGAGGVYGSLFSPADFGAGEEGGGLPCDRGRGGGAVWVTSAGASTVDGLVSADGAAGAAGGSLRLEAPSLGGRGSIEALGGDAGLSGTGGGGRIALHVGEVTEELLSRVSAAGGSHSSPTRTERQGAAGTLYVKRPEGAFGELVLDNAGRQAAAPIQVTFLPSVGRGTVDAVGEASITDLEADLPHDLTGAWVAIDDDLDRLFRITAHDRQTLQLDTSEMPLAATPGMSYRGVYRFDRVTVRGAAHGATRDLVVAEGGIEVAEGSTWVMDESEPPIVEIALDPGDEVLVDSELRIAATAADGSGLLRVETEVTGVVEATFLDLPEGATATTVENAVALPLLFETASLEVTVRAVDALGLESGTVRQVTVLPDTTPPAVLSHEPAAGTTFAAGDPILIRADVADDVRLAGVTFRFAGDSRSFALNELFEWTVTAPAVAAPTPFDVVIESTDSSGNVGTFTISILVEPRLDTGIPEVDFACPSPGALLPTGAALDLHVAAADDEGIDRVELFLGAAAAPFETLRIPPFVGRVDAPAGGQAGELVTVRAVVYDFGGNSAEAQLDLVLADGVRFDGDETIAATDLGVDGLPVVVEGGSLTIEGPHTFDDLIVLDGAAVTHPFTTASVEERLDLTLTGRLYVACGGAVDATGRGYLPGISFPNSSEDGPGNLSGSHGGEGGSRSRNPTYGSLFDPRDPGTGSGGSGGGVVRLEAAGPVVVDGAILADGGVEAGGSRRGAGGSVRLDAPSVSGRGRIEASTSGAGGGRVAVYSDGLDPELTPRILALGGAAGTVYLKSPDQELGELIVDGGAGGLSGRTVLVPVGRGTVGSVDPTGFTDPAASFRHTVVGAWVAFGELGELWRITDHQHKGQRLGLDTAAAALAAQAGDAYRGVYRFDRVTVRNGGHLFLDDLLSTAELVVDDSSLVIDGDDDAGVRATIGFSPAGAVFAGQVLRFTAWAGSGAELDRMEIAVSGAVVDSFTVEGSGERFDRAGDSYPIPAGSAGQEVTVRLTAFDVLGRSLEVERSIPVVADLEPPSVTVFEPFHRQRFRARDPVPIRLEAADNAAFESLTVELGGRTSLWFRPDVELTLLAPPVDATSDVPLRITAVDAAGNARTLTRTIVVDRFNDAVPPQLMVGCPSPGALAVPGQLLPASTSFVEDDGLFSLEAFAPGAAEPLVAVFPSLSARFADLDIPVPAALLPGPATLRVVATDYGNNRAEVTIPLRVIDATVIGGSLVTLAADDLSLDGGDVAVVAVELTIEGPHTFRNLAVLQGRVVHPETDASIEQRLELEIAEDLYVACGGAIRADGRGYLGSDGIGLGYTFPNSQVGGARFRDGGSHGGRGGSFGPDPYGSIFDPSASGGGGGSGSGLQPGADGGGVIRIASGGSAIVDGEITAMGAEIGGSAGAGGAIRLDAARLAGSGRIAADGGDHVVPGGAGGGGRIALYAESIEPPLRERTTAYGGDNLDFILFGGNGVPGTVYFKEDAQPFGDLLLDNRGRRPEEATALPPLGLGTVDAVGADTITDFGRVFGPGAIGVDVAFNFDYARTWRVVGFQGPTLTLDVSDDPLTAQVGDSYRGVYRFDRVVVRGMASGRSDDFTITADPPEVEDGSAWVAGNNAQPPVIDAARLGFSFGILGLSLVGEPGAVTDSESGQLFVTVLGTTTAVAADGSFSLAVFGEDGTVLEVTASDGGFPSLSSTVSVGPLTGGAGVSPTLGETSAAAFDPASDLLAACNCFGQQELRAPPRKAEIDVDEGLSLFDLGDPLRPVLASAIDLYGGGGAPGCEEACGSCFDACPAGDLVCENACDVCFEVCDVTESCEGSCAACRDECSASGGGAGCFAACDACSETCEAGTDIELFDIRNPVDEMAAEDGAVAMIQGPFLRVVDVRDPARPVLRDAEQALLPPNFGGFGALDIEEGYVHLVETFFPHTYFVFDVHDPQRPRLVSTVSLPVRDVAEIEVADGLLHVASNGIGSSGEYKVFEIGDPGDPILRRSTDFAASSRSASSLARIDDVTAYGLDFGGVATLHRGQAAGEAPSLTELPIEISDLEEVGDKVILAPGFDRFINVGEVATGFADHGFTFEQEIDEPRGDRVGDVEVASRLLWLRQFSINGYQSSLLRPWLDARRITAVVASGGARVVAEPGTVGDGGSTVTATFAGDAVTGPVAADGSFDLFLPGVEAGERVRLQAADPAGDNGHRVRLRVAAGVAAGRLELAAGAARLSVAEGLAAVVPDRQETTPVSLSLVSVGAGGLAVPGAVEAPAPVRDAVLRGGVLYVGAGDGLHVFDVSDPAAPGATAVLDLYAGQPVVAVVESGDTLLTLGAAGGGLELKTVDLTNALMPSEAPLLATAVPDVASPRLSVDGSDLWLVGDGRASVYTLAPGEAPALRATGAFSGRELMDVEPSGGQAWAAVRDEGVYPLAIDGATITLGPPPLERHHAFGLFRLTGRLWWAEGLGGAKTVLAVEEPSPGTPVPRYGVLSAGCDLRDGLVAGDDLFLLTGCGLQRIDLTP